MQSNRRINAPPGLMEFEIGYENPCLVTLIYEPTRAVLYLCLESQFTPGSVVSSQA